MSQIASYNQGAAFGGFAYPSNPQTTYGAPQYQVAQQPQQQAVPGYNVQMPAQQPVNNYNNMPQQNYYVNSRQPAAQQPAKNNEAVPAVPRGEICTLVEFCEKHGGKPGKINVRLDNVVQKDTQNKFVSIRTMDGKCVLAFPKDNAALHFEDKQPVMELFKNNKDKLMVITGTKDMAPDGKPIYTIYLDTSEEFEC